MIQAGLFYGKLDLRIRSFKVAAFLQQLSLLQEEVMEFEINDLEILDNSQASNPTSALISSQQARSGMMTNLTQNSLILNELHKENEELQNKLKLNYRRLLLFETENNKLIEEKNKFFFENQDYYQKNQLLSEKNAELEAQNSLNETQQKLLSEKISSYEKINKTQLLEIKRFSKFHTKIQDVVKPFIVQLKKQVQELTDELTQAKKVNGNLVATYKEFCKKMELDLNQKTNEILGLHAEKNSIVQTYEEQIHSFSKEIVDLQSQNENHLKEISRLKKAIEFKNYFENEVIRFKRIHEEDQVKINEQTQKRAMAEAQILSLEQSLQEVRATLGSKQNKIQDLEANLEVTRVQFSKKIDELNTTYERVNRLEKLNNQLSQEMSKT
jgi:hypothetical protein